MACGGCGKVKTLAVSRITLGIFMCESMIEAAQFGLAPVLTSFLTQEKCFFIKFLLFPCFKLRVFTPIQGAAVQFARQGLSVSGVRHGAGQEVDRAEGRFPVLIQDIVAPSDGLQWSNKNFSICPGKIFNIAPIHHLICRHLIFACFSASQIAYFSWLP